MKLKKMTIGTTVLLCLLGPTVLNAYAEESQHIEKENSQISNAIDKKLSDKERIKNIEKGISDAGVQDGWQYSIFTDSTDSSNNCAVLVGYIGDSQTNITIPGEIKGLPTLIDLENFSTYFTFDINNIRNITFTEKNGKKATPGRLVGTNWGGSRVQYETSLNFKACKSNLETLDARGLNTSKITSFRESFIAFKNLRSVNFDNCNTANVTDMSYMFSECTNLQTASFKGWNTQKVTRMQQMFYGCGRLEELDLSSFSTPKLGEMEFMFAGCGASIIRLDNFDMSATYNKSNIFTNTPSGKELLITTREKQLLNYNYSGRVPFKTPKLNANGGKFQDNSTEKNYFEQCAVNPDKLSITQFEKFKQSNTPTNSGFGGQFLGWQKVGEGSDSPSTVLDILKNTYIAQWGNVNWEFEENDSRILLTKYKGNSNEVVVPTNFNGKQIVLKDINTNIIPTRVQKFSVDKSSSYKLIIEDSDLNFAFDQNNNLREVDFRGMDTSNITKMEVMFRNCKNLRKANFSNIDMSKVIAMDYTFQNCQNLTDVDFSNTNTSVLSDTRRMFTGCNNLKIIDLRSFQLTSNAVCSNMFFVDEPSELLVLTNDIKIQSINYKTNNRIPLDGVKLDSNGGVFSNNQSIKKYFEKCVYPPEKIQLSEFEKFKQENKPVRTEFATTFASWEPEQSEPQNPANVLDLGNLTYRATWEDPNWEFTETEDEIKLTRYKGTNSEVNIPVYANGKSFKISGFSEQLIPKTVTKIICRPDSLGRKLFCESNGMSSAFSEYTNLVEIDLTGIDVRNVINLGHMFYKCSNLKKVNISNWDTSQVKWIDSIFEDCFKLTNIDISNWDTSNVINMSRMFFNVPVEYLDLSNWKTPNLESTNRMFNGCSNLKLIKMENFDMSNVNNKAAMFYRGNATETLVVTRDRFLLNEYNFKNDNTYPNSKPVLDANGGVFEDGSQVKKYFDHPAVAPETLQISNFEEFKNNNTPLKDEAIFRGWTESTTNKTVTDEGVLDLLDKTYSAIWKNTSCNTTSDNRKISTQGNIGFVYIPNEMSIPTTELTEFGEQRIGISKEQTLNLGIRDLSQNTNSNWSVSGQLKWNGKDIPGAYIQVDSNSDSVKKNINNNVNPFDASKDLIAANKEVTSPINGSGHLKITSEYPNILMQATQNIAHDDIYDYDLGEATLVIPDTQYVQDGHYTANLEWNLSNVP